jgi:hypothetical protein
LPEQVSYFLREDIISRTATVQIPGRNDRFLKKWSRMAPGPTQFRIQWVKVKVKVTVKVKFALEQATKAQMGSRGIALLFL